MPPLAHVHSEGEHVPPRLQVQHDSFARLGRGAIDPQLQPRGRIQQQLHLARRRHFQLTRTKATVCIVFSRTARSLKMGNSVTGNVPATVL